MNRNAVRDLLGLTRCLYAVAEARGDMVQARSIVELGRLLALAIEEPEASGMQHLRRAVQTLPRVFADPAVVALVEAGVRRVGVAAVT